jgi:hypothetical protein
MDQERSPRGNARWSGSGGASSSKHKSGGGGGKKPIKVLYIDNPMRVKTSASGFRALVQELTGRHADPSKYSPDDLDSGGVAQGLSPRAAGASSETIVASPSPRPAGNKAAPHGGDCGYDDEEDGFRSQLLLENNYTVFSPPTLLYDHHPHSKV